MRKISQLEVIKYFWDNNIFCNRCYINMVSNCGLVLRFDEDIELDTLISRFNQFCKNCKVSNDNVTIEHKEFSVGRFISKTNRDYVVWFNVFTSELI